MTGRISLMALVAGVGVVAIIVLAVLLGSATSSIASDLNYQCDTAIGSDPSETETLTPTSTSAAAAPSAAARTAPVPTTNPYAELTVAPGDSGASDWWIACATALKSAPYQQQPLQTHNDGIAVECARELAQAATERGDSGAAAQTGAAALARTVIYQASSAAVTGRCTSNVQPTVDPVDGAAARNSDATKGLCDDSAGTGPVVVRLPNTVAAQAVCGQRVDPSAVSPGDLIFWDYRDNAPTRVGVAVSATELVAADTTSATIMRQSIPTSREVRVKRVLEGGP